MREIVLDTETTGLNYKAGDRIIEVGCVELINHVSTTNNLQFYCSTNKIIDESATKIHGLTNAFLNEHPPFKDHVKKFLKFIGNDPIVIHNAEFDMGFINNELKLSNIDPLKNKVIDTVFLARKTLNTRIANLDYLCRRFSIDLSARKFHGALLDCQLLSEVYLELLGGRQTTLALKDSHNNEPDPKHGKEIQRGKVHRIQVSSEEIQKHKEFIANLNKPLWHKIDY